jgi:NAD+-dependent protein deacetylase SIR2
MKTSCRRLSRRDKLTAYNTIDDAVNLLRSSKRIVILTGAGISTCLAMGVRESLLSVF